MSGYVTCPYCHADEIDPRGLVSHVRMCNDDVHGGKYDVPDDLEEQIDEHVDDAQAKKIDFRNVEIDAEPETTMPDYCDSCGATDLYELDDGEPINMGGEVVGYGDDGDVICLQCGEIVRGEIND